MFMYPALHTALHLLDHPPPSEMSLSGFQVRFLIHFHIFFMI